jgi:hypothetical protein
VGRLIEIEDRHLIEALVAKEPAQIEQTPSVWRIQCCARHQGLGTGIYQCLVARRKSINNLVLTQLPPIITSALKFWLCAKSLDHHLSSFTLWILPPRRAHRI